MALFNQKYNKHYIKGATKRRSLVKAITWRILGTLDTMIISYILTGHLKIALSIGGIEIFTKMVLYFFHERVWNIIAWGRRKNISKS